MKCRSIVLTPLVFLSFITSPGTAQWRQSNYINGRISCLAVDGLTAFAGTDTNGLYISNDEGETWSKSDSGLTGRMVVSISVISTSTGGSEVFVGTQLNGLFKSADHGISWTKSGLPLPTPFVTCVGSSGNNLIAGTHGKGAFLSTDDGSTWKESNTGLTGPYVTSVLLISTQGVGRKLLAGTTDVPSIHNQTYDVGVFVSSDDGDNWSVFGLKDTSISCLAQLGSSVIAGTYGMGFVLSPDFGKSWQMIDSGMTARSPYSLVVNGSSLYAGTWYGVFASDNNGASWREVNEGLANVNMYSVAVCGAHLLAGTWGNGIWCRPLSELTAVIGNHTDLPEQGPLQQNFPNPFNPITVISYTIPKYTHVTLKIFDVLGREVETLVNENEQVGRYKVNFDGARLASGVYFYKLVAGSHVITKKMLLLK